MIKSSFVVFLLIALTFCTNKKKSNHIEFYEHNIPKVNLKSKKINFDEIVMPIKINRKGKYLFVMESKRTSTDVPAIHIIDTENWNYYRRKGVKGYGPLELAVVSSFFPGKDSGTFEVYSAQDKKMLEYSIHDNSLVAKSEYKQPEIVYKVVKISQASDSTFLGISVDDPNKLIEFNKDGDKVAAYGTWEKVLTHPSLTNFQLYNLNRGWFKGDMRLGLHVNACLFRDRLEIFNYDTKDFIIVDGPNLELPNFEIIGQDLYIPLEDNPYTYRDISFTDDFIFALYGGIGEFEYRETSQIANKIYVFSHSGEPTILFNLDRSIVGLTVDFLQKKIYGITTDEDPGIAVFDLSEVEFSSN